MANIYSTLSNGFVEGTEDEDTIVVLGNNDTIFGYGDDDLIHAVGNGHVLYGDSLVTGGPDAGTGDDTLVGGPGDDTMWGGAGADTMSGSGGADIFSFGWVPQARGFVLDTTDFQGQNDLIVDFSQGQNDRIDLSGYLEGGEAAVFLGTNPFTSETALQVRYDIVGDKTVLQFRVPLPVEPVGPMSTGEIDLAGNIALTVDNFVPVLEDRSGGLMAVEPDTMGEEAAPPTWAGHTVNVIWMDPNDQIVHDLGNYTVPPYTLDRNVPGVEIPGYYPGDWMYLWADWFQYHTTNHNWSGETGATFAGFKVTDVTVAQNPEARPHIQTVQVDLDSSTIELPQNANPAALQYGNDYFQVNLVGSAITPDAAGIRLDLDYGFV